MTAAESCDGWLGGQLLIPLDAVNARVIVGVWETKSHWEAWHSDPAFIETRRRLADLGVETGETTWYETMYEANVARE